MRSFRGCHRLLGRLPVLQRPPPGQGLSWPASSSRGRVLGTSAICGNASLLFHTATHRSSSYASVTGDFISDRVAPTSSLVSWRVDDPVRIRFNPDCAVASRRPLMVQTVLRATTRRYPKRVALKIKREGNWVTWTYEEYLKDVEVCARALIALGFERRDRVGVMGANAPEWVISAIAAVMAGGLYAGVYNSSSPEIVSHLARSTPFHVFFVEDASMLNYVLSGRSPTGALPVTKHIVLMQGEKKSLNNDKCSVLTWREFLALGLTEPKEKLEKREREAVANEACTIVFTSGTTGPPKGALMSHDNLTFTSRVVGENINFRDGQETVMSYLPAAHLAGQLLDIYGSITAGATIAFADKEALKGTLVANLMEVRPTHFVGVPRVFEKIHAKFTEADKQSTNLVKKALLAWARKQASAHSQQLREGQSRESLGYKIAQKLVLLKIQDALGLQVPARDSSIYSASAHIPVETYNFFESIGMTIRDHYGATETSGLLTGNTLANLMPKAGSFTYLQFPTGARKTVTDVRPGTVGIEYPGFKAGLVDQDETGCGEITSSGRNTFMGYLNEEKKTLETFTEDFKCRLGDLGRFDADGYLTIEVRYPSASFSGWPDYIHALGSDHNYTPSIVFLHTGLLSKSPQTCLNGT